MKDERRGSILFLHGFLGSPKDWAPVLKELKDPQDWNVVCVNLWDDLPPLRFDSMTEWLDAFAEKYGALSSLILCGYSLGGRLAMAFACRRPDLLKALIVVSGHPGLLSQAEKKARLAEDRRWARIFSNEPWDRALSRWNRRTVFVGHQIRPKRESFTPEKLAAALEIFSLGTQQDLRQCLQRLRIPILWVVGEKDAKFVEIANETWRSESSISVKTIPNCGHRVPHEKPRALAVLLNSFFAQINI
ncbi:MAG TPA: alpha/beta fold hydrolase [Chthoniobacterales bacterium]